jgi:hypothetical protein
MVYVDKFIMTVIGVLAAGFGGLIIVAIKWLFNINKNVNGMVENGKHRAAENKLQFQMFKGYGKGIESHGAALKTLIEITAQNKINGNVEKAFEEIKKADVALADVTEKYGCYFDSLVTYKGE